MQTDMLRKQNHMNAQMRPQKVEKVVNKNRNEK